MSRNLTASLLLALLQLGLFSPVLSPALALVDLDQPTIVSPSLAGAIAADFVPPNRGIPERRQGGGTR